MRIKNTSFSALDTFSICPLKYKFKEIDKIKTPKSPEAVFGTLVHSTMKYIHGGGFLSPTQKDALNYFSKNWNSEVFKDELVERAAFAQGVKIIQDYYKKNDPAAADIVDLESRFSVEIEDLQNQQVYLLSGVIDRIDKTPDGFEIIDYKTARKLPPQSKIEEDLQLPIYLLALIKRYPHLEKTPEKVILSLYFLRHGLKLSTTKTAAQLEEEKERIINLINEINKSDFSPRLSPLCDWCDFQALCPMWKHKFKKEENTLTEKEKREIIKKYLNLQEEIKEKRQQMATLQTEIIKIMKKEKVERLFNQDKIIAKTLRTTYEYDQEKIKPLLEKSGLWEKVIKLDNALLKKVLLTLPPALQCQVEKAKKIKRETWSLSVKKNKEMVK